MRKTIPSTADIAKLLRTMTASEIDGLAQKSGVPRGTIMNIRSFQTENAGIDTVRKLYDYLPKLVTRKKVVKA